MLYNNNNKNRNLKIFLCFIIVYFNIDKLIENSIRLIIKQNKK